MKDSIEDYLKQVTINAYIGVAGSGKDTLAKSQCDVTFSFAHAARQELISKILEADYSDELYEDFKQGSISLTENGKKLIDISGRKMLQNYAEYMKILNGDNYWAKKTVENILSYIRDYYSNVKNGFKHLVIGIPDCRFNVEISELKKLSHEKHINVRFIHANIITPRYDPNIDHISEILAKRYINFNGSQDEFNAIIWGNQY